MLGSLDAEVASRVVAAGSDVAMLIDRDGVICDIALANEDLHLDGLDGWLDKRWADTVTVESRIKVEELLRDAASKAATRWREVNHPTPRGESVALRYTALDAGRDGHIIAMGRDHRPAAMMQQRLIEAQQSMERDYARLRDAESRYRLLFQLAAEAVLIVDAASRRVVEANPAADRLIGGDGAIVGRAFPKIFAVQTQEAAAALLSVAQASSRPTGSQARLTFNGRDLQVSASLFRQDRTAHFLVRLAPVDRGETTASEANLRLLSVLERMPDGFVVTDEALQIIAENAAFLDLVRIPSKEQARGLALDRFLGRPGIDRNILLDMLRKHGAVRNFSTVLRTQFFEQEDVEVSAVAVLEGAQPCFGFSIRGVTRRDVDTGRLRRPELPHSPAEMSELVGRASLKEIVRDTTDLVERLCIEAALELTGNNRASAAEVLGLSRQSLYSKLHRYGIGNLDSDPG
ncbi:MAG: transcriptional regulator PpsR [Hyphomonadaceae bacterium]|nr:transcriptional regulator PpsR [Hyphomonadaceae bacterium]